MGAKKTTDTADDTLLAGAGDDTILGSAGDDTIVAGEGADLVSAILADDPNTAALVEAGADEPLVSRDERHDSIDPATGALSAEALALRTAAKADADV